MSSYFQQSDTIAAIATPHGIGGVSIIRVSGPQAIEVASKIFRGSRSEYETHKAYFGKIIDSQSKVIDEVLFIIMKAPRSFSGEDVVEIHCHGSPLITRKILDALLQEGARSALPGEFSFRAYINGKLDLTQAEAIQELIGAKSELALQQASNQLQGILSEKIKRFQAEITEIAAILEAWVDFPEEDLEEISKEELLGRLNTICEEMLRLENTFYDGKILREGAVISIIGSPNVGKSSLMNALLGEERAIVTDLPGTTRDVLQEDLRIGEMSFRLTDTAGIRETTNIIELEGIKRSRKVIQDSDLVLLVLDIEQGLEREKAFLKELPQEKTLAIWNKTDRPHAPPPLTPFTEIQISVKNRSGLDALKAAIQQFIWKKAPLGKDEILLTNLRHKDALSSALESLLKTIENLKNETSPELTVLDLRHTLTELGKIIGTDVTEDILNSIFSKFCIGK